MKKINLDKYKYLSLYFILIQILILIRNYLLNENILFYFYCDHIAFLLAIAFFIKNIPLIKALISTGIIAQTIYLTNLLTNLIFNFQIINLSTEYLTYSPLILAITIIMHISTILIALAFTYKEKNNIKSLKYAFIYTIALYITTILFTPVKYDINCISNACGMSFFQFNQQKLFWPIITFTLLTIPGHYFQEFLYKISKTKLK